MEFPLYYTIYIYVFLPILLGAIFYSLTKAKQLNSYKIIFWSICTFLIVWSSIMFYLGNSSFFVTNKLPTGPIATGIFLVISLFSYFFIVSVRKFLLSIPIRWLIFPQIFRILGGIFIFVTLDHLLPTYWGFMVGFGDFLTGIFAIPVLITVIKKQTTWVRNVVLWSIFGLGDIVHAIIAATLMTPSPFQMFHFSPGVETTNYYPLILIVVIARPMVVFIHLLIVFKLLTTKKAE